MVYTVSSNKIYKVYISIIEYKITEVGRQITTVDCGWLRQNIRNSPRVWRSLLGSYCVTETTGNSTTLGSEKEGSDHRQDNCRPATFSLVI